MAFWNMWQFWLVLAGVYALAYTAIRPMVKRFPILNNPMAMILIGLVGAGATSGAFAAMGFATARRIDSASAVPQLADLVLSNGHVNESSTDDYLTNNDHTMTMYIQDTDIVDNGYINFSLTGVRLEGYVDKAQSVKVVCNFDTRFEYNSIIENLANEDTDGTLADDYTTLVDATHVQNDEQVVTGYMEFAEGVVTDTVTLKFGQEETSQDYMTEKDSLDIVCNAGGKSVNVVLVADN